MSITAWSGRLAAVGATPHEVAAITASYYSDPTDVQAALDTLIGGIANVDLLTMLNTWRTSGAPFHAGFPGGGLPFGAGVALLTGNANDDADAIGAGTGVRIPQAALVRVFVAADYTAVEGQAVHVDTSNGPVTITLPPGPENNAAVSVTMDDQNPDNPAGISVIASGGPTFAGGATLYLIPGVDSPVSYRFATGQQTWFTAAASQSLQYLDTRYLSSTGAVSIDGELTAAALETAGVPGITTGDQYWGRLETTGQPGPVGPNPDGTWHDGDSGKDPVTGGIWSYFNGAWVIPTGGTPPAPSVGTGAATAVTQTTATFNGTVNPENNAGTEFQFEFGTSLAYGGVVPVSVGAVGSDTTTYPVSSGATGLTPSTLYHVRCNALIGGAVVTHGPDQTFSTLPTSPSPTVTAGTTTGITQTGAVMASNVNPNGLTTTALFNYGTVASAGFGSSTSSGAVGSDNTPHTVAATLSGLTPNTAYQYQCVATNANPPTTGPTQTFTTSPGAAPVVITDPVLS